MWNTCLRSGGLLVSFVSVYVSKLGVSKRSIGKNLFGSAIQRRCDVRCKRTDRS